ncbi:hypothetical protein HID58_056440 [Brassica napus]|uniref:Arabidopsis retrotransposon Orf1 C-terminal domain-containing protein n=1 Tax=Brassica napus TaxID=3708 RepID=A0ABQ8AN82_BRANA|nr:hypothetical protein HID58_056440 [Brassica napus]
MNNGNPKISGGVRPRTSTAAHVRPRKSIREGQSRAQSCGLSPRPGAVHGLSPSKRRGRLTRRIMVRENRPERPLRLTHNPRPVPRLGTVRENRSERACSHAQSRSRLTRLPPVRGLAQAMTRTTCDLPKKFGAPKKSLIDGGDASTSNNKNGQAQAKKKVDKGKDVVIEAEDPDHSSSGSSSQEEEESSYEANRQIPSATAINNKLRAMKLQPSLFVDEEILEKLGILSDVQLLLGNMELWKMMSTCQRGYPVPACQFLSTFEATFHISHDPHETEGHGFITFKVDRKSYKMGFKEIASVIGLRDRRRHKFKKFEGELNKFWKEIGAGEYDISAIKSADILHPALRYKWAWTNHDKKPKLFILGFITPLLEVMNIPLVGDEIEFAVMDETGLVSWMGSLMGSISTAMRKESCSVLLPCLPSTSLRYRENLTFNPPSSALLHLATQDMPLKISRKKKQPGDSSSQSEDVEQPPPSKVYGSTRYYFAPRTASLPEGPLRDAHNQIRALQRGQKYQDRTISRLVKSVNYLTGKLKKLTMRTRRSHASTTEASEEKIWDDMQTEATEPVHDHRHSYQGDAIATQSYYEAHRSSVREPRERRNRRQRHPVPSLPSPDTDNESPFSLS